MTTFNEIISADFNVELSTSLTMADFNKASLIEFERDGLGLWAGFTLEVAGVGEVFVMAPDPTEPDNKTTGCTVMFKRISDRDDLIVARTVSARVSKEGSRWMYTTTGQQLVLD